MTRELTRDLQKMAAGFLFLLSLPLILVGLKVVGWGTHRDYSLSCLHLECLTQPEPWCWQRHLPNLRILALGLLWFVGSVAFFVVLARQKEDGE